jgi:hypothetical protein
MNDLNFIVIINCCYQENAIYIQNNYNDKRIIINKTIIKKNGFMEVYYME